MGIRILVLLFLQSCWTTELFSQFDEQLCKKEEAIVFAFQLNNQKWVSVCKGKNEQYIVYRFGVQNKIELEYPKKLDSTSWQYFSFKGYNRGGGKQNAAMYYAFLNFSNNEITYKVYQTWDSENDLEHCGVSVIINGKETGLKGVIRSIKGSLLSLLYNEKIHKEEEE